MHIISGKKKGKKIISPNIYFRPTQSKLKEALFNIINVSGKTFLDLCAGSGAVGLEALSRGANHVTFVDIERESIKTLFKNAKSIFGNSDIYQIKRISAVDYIKNTDGHFDIIYLDPPYDSNIYREIIYNVINRNLINNGGVLVAETSLNSYKKFSFLKPTNYDFRKYGESVLLFFYINKIE